jgi:hypothetical protein
MSKMTTRFFNDREIRAVWNETTLLLTPLKDFGTWICLEEKTIYL